MKKIYTSLLVAVLTTASLFAQIPQPLEQYKFTNGSLAGENGTSSGGGITPIITSIDDPFGNPNEAIELDGSTQYSLGNPGLNTSNGLTVSFWLKPTAATTDNKVRIIFAQRDRCANTNTISSFVRNGDVFFEIRSNNGGASISIPYELDNWQKVTFVVDASNNYLVAYKNGRLTSSTSFPSNRRPTTFRGNDIKLTGSPCIGVDGTQRYNGGIDELSFYNTSLKEEQVNILYGEDTREEFIDSKLLVHYKLDSTLQNETFLNQVLAEDYNSELKAYHFNGQRDFSFTQSAFSTGNGFSVSFWIKPQLLSGGSYVIISQRAACNGSVDFFRIVLNPANNEITMVLSRAGRSAEFVSLSYTAEIWQKCTFVFSRGSNQIISYKNGQEVQTKSTFNSSGVPNSFSPADLLLASSACVGVDGTKKYAGDLDEVFIYESTLSATDVLNAFTSDNDAQFNPVFSTDFDDISSLYYTSMNIVNRPVSGVPSFDKAATFDGTTTTYNLGKPVINTIPQSGYTFSFWLNPDVSTSSKGVIFSKRASCSNTNTFVMSTNGQTKELLAEFRTSAGPASGLRMTYTENQWQFVTFTVDLENNFLRGYINGVEEAAITVNGNEFAYNYSSGDLLLAGSPCVGVDGSQRYKGALDDLKIYGYPLNSSDVFNTYQSQVISGNSTRSNELDNINFYPNPADEFIITRKGSIRIYDSMGKKVLETQTNEKIDVSHLSSGIYFVSNGEKIQKIQIK